MKILLIGNYGPDGQQSMERFARYLERELLARNIATRLLRPAKRTAGNRNVSSGLGKWLAYVDKFILFPSLLRRETAALGPDEIVHICDHSNSVYSRWTPHDRTLITCHDLLAVRGALGEDTDCPATAAGRQLQRWILRGLRRATAVACVSSCTQKDFLRLVGATPPSRVILSGINAPFRHLQAADVRPVLETGAPGLTRQPYLLHVGSSLRRKNREGILRVFARISQTWPGVLVFAGDALHADQQQLAKSLGISDRVREIVRPDGALLEALYNGAHALLFPSRFEGFGWPILEAQACGCPVICADTTSLPEVAGKGARVLPVTDEAGMAAAVVELDDAKARNQLISAGFENLKRFTTDRMMSEYLSMYDGLLGKA